MVVLGRLYRAAFGLVVLITIVGSVSTVLTNKSSPAAAASTHETSVSEVSIPLEAAVDIEPLPGVPRAHDRPPGTHDARIARLFHGAILSAFAASCDQKYLAYGDLIWPTLYQLFGELVPHGGLVMNDMMGDEMAKVGRSYPSYGQPDVPSRSDCARLKTSGDAAWLDQLVYEINTEPQEFY